MPANQYWHSFECSCGVLWDIRTSHRELTFAVSCWACLNHSPRYRGFWAADSGGFGSRGDIGPYVSLGITNDVSKEEWHCIEERAKHNAIRAKRDLRMVRGIRRHSGDL
jgi:hypothetical protein